MPMKTAFYTVDGELLATEASGVRSDLLPEALGSVVTVSDSSGAVQRSQRYKPYGSDLSSSGAGPRPSYGWVGRQGYRESALSLAEHYVRARHYSDGSGRWRSVDPLWPEERAFGYCHGEPIDWMDPTGLQKGSGGGAVRTGPGISTPPAEGGRPGPRFVPPAEPPGRPGIGGPPTQRGGPILPPNLVNPGNPFSLPFVAGCILGNVAKNVLGQGVAEPAPNRSPIYWPIRSQDDCKSARDRYHDYCDKQGDRGCPGNLSDCGERGERAQRSMQCGLLRAQVIVECDLLTPLLGVGDPWIKNACKHQHAMCQAEKSACKCSAPCPNTYPSKAQCANLERSCQAMAAKCGKASFW